MISKRNIVWVTHDGGRCYVNVERIIAVNPKKKRIYFESTFWDLDENDFMSICEAWTDADVENEEY